MDLKVQFPTLRQAHLPEESVEVSNDNRFVAVSYKYNNPKVEYY